MPQRAVIIGAGITGTLTGLELLRAGWDVLVLEAEHVGSGSSSRTAAGIRQQFTTKETVLGMRYSVQYYRDFVEIVGGETCPIKQNGYLFLTRDGRKAAEERVALQKSCGLDDVEFLEGADLASRFDFVDPEAVECATWCPSDGFLRPEVIYNEAAAAIQREGGKLLMNTKVDAARVEGDRIVALGSRDRWFEADLFIDATNAWSPRVARAMGATEVPVAPYKRYLWFLERAGPISAERLLEMPMVVTPSGAYCRPENKESLLCGWAHKAREESDFSYEDQDAIEPAFFHRSGADSRAYDTWMALAEALPPLAEFAGITATTGGYYATTPDHNPFLGYDPLRDNLIRLVGFSGHGAMFGPFTAKVGVALAEAGKDLPEIELLGRTATLGTFSMRREFGAHEQMVI